VPIDPGGCEVALDPRLDAIRRAIDGDTQVRIRRKNIVTAGARTICLATAPGCTLQVRTPRNAAPTTITPIQRATAGESAQRDLAGSAT
jgi:hypothetical protein